MSDYKKFRDDYDINRKINEIKFSLINQKPSVSDLTDFVNGEIKFYRYVDNNNNEVENAVIRIDDKLYKINLELLE